MIVGDKIKFIKMIKSILKVLLLTTLIIVSSCKTSKSTMSYDSEIEMEDGKIITGKVNYPLKLEDDILKINNNNIETSKIKKVTFFSSFGNLEYHNLLVYNYNGKKIKKKKKLLSLIVSGKVKLYFGESDVVMQVGSSNGMRNFNNGSTVYYCLREGEPAATFLHENWNQTSKNADFKSNAKRYFSDNPAIIEKINNKTYTYKNIISLVNDYNNN
jgi:hypothetical protein